MAYPCKTNPCKECDGCGGCEEERTYYCPVCGKEIWETVYISNDGEILGCDNCAQIKEPWEVFDNETY